MSEYALQWDGIQGTGIQEHGEEPFLSVVIPTYNRRESLRLTLEGLARQTFPAERFEAVVVCDGATDGTERLVAEIAPMLPYPLRFVMQQNGGPSRARNRGVTEARGQVIVFLDDDMEPLSDFLAEHARQHEGPGASENRVVIGPMLPDPERRPVEPVWIAWEHAMLEKQYDAWRTGLWPGAGPNHFYSGNASLRRAHLLYVGGFDESFKRQEDVELAYRLERLLGLEFAFHPGAAGLHRPDRSFEGWARVPFAYGGLDVERARRGDASAWKVVRDGYRERNPITRLVAALVLTIPQTAAPVYALLRTLAVGCYRLRPDHSRVDSKAARAAFALLSALYNVRYVDGARKELDTDPTTRSVPVWAQASPFSTAPAAGAALPVGAAPGKVRRA